LSRRDLIKKLKKINPKLSNSNLEIIIDTFSKSIEEALTVGKKVELRGLGVFFIKKIKEKYSARNPKTGELIYIPPKNKVRFKSSKILKKFIND
jgi:integration host factor subunit beta